VNLIGYSNQFDSSAYWVFTLGGNTVTVLPSASIAPNGENRAFKIVTTALLGVHGIITKNNITTTLGETYTISVYAKQAGWSRIGIRAGRSALDLRCTVDLTNGSIVNNSNGVCSVFDVGDGWYKVSITGIVTSVDFQTVIETHNTTLVQATELGDGTSGIFIWGAQLEAGNLNPYQPTTGSNNIGALVPATVDGYIPNGLTDIVSNPASNGHNGAETDINRNPIGAKELVNAGIPLNNIISYGDTLAHPSYNRGTTTETDYLVFDGALSADDTTRLTNKGW
jgi:hypothetical protein